MPDDFVVPEFDLTRNINLRDPQLLDTFRGILDRRTAGSLNPRGAANIIKEEIGERQALDILSRRFPGARAVVVAERPNGVPILDAVLRTPDGRFVIVEAKFSSAGRVRYGRTNSRMLVQTQNGWKAINVKGATTQMSPKWIEDRLAELRASGTREARRLAGELNQALREGRFNAYTVVTDSTGEVRKVIDNTAELSKSYTQPGVEMRTMDPAGGAGTPELETAGDRALANRLGSAAAAEEAEVAAARRGTALVTREGTEVAARELTLRGAAAAVGRVLTEVLVRFIAVLDLVGLALMAVDVVTWIWDHFKDEAIDEALKKGLKDNLPGEIDAALKQHQDEIAGLYARTWRDKGFAGELFMYLSPRIEVTGGFEGEFHYTAALPPVTAVATDLVSTSFLEPTRRETAWSGPSWSVVEIRWSAKTPIYTPFDIYLALTESFVKHIVHSWARRYAAQPNLSADLVKLFYKPVESLAYVSATLKAEPWFGYDDANRSFSARDAAIARWEALKKLSKRIMNDVAPAVSALEAKRLITARPQLWFEATDPLRSELDPGGETSLLPSLRRLEVEMDSLDSSHLDYERSQTIYARTAATLDQSLIGAMDASIDAQQRVDLAEYLKPVRQYLPESLAPAPPAGIVIPAGGIVFKAAR